MPRQGEASSGNVSDKQEWERGLFGQLLSNSTGSKTLIPVPHTPWATYTNTSWQGARTAARTGQRQRVHVNYLWKYATDCGLAEAACNLPWGILFHTNWNYRRKRERLKERTEPEPEADTGTGTAWHGLLLCVPFKVNLPGRLSVGWAVCAGILITTATTKTSTTAAPTCHTLQ